MFAITGIRKHRSGQIKAAFGNLGQNKKVFSFARFLIMPFVAVDLFVCSSESLIVFLNLSGSPRLVLFHT